MELKVALKDSWKLTKSNFILMMTVLSVGVFLSLLAMTPFVGESEQTMSLISGWGRITLFGVFYILITIIIQIAFFAASGQRLSNLSSERAWKNIASIFVVMLVFQLTAWLFEVITIMFAQSGELPIWYLITLGVCLLTITFVSFRLSFFVYYILEYNQNLLIALKASWELTARKWLPILGLYFGGYLLFLVGVLALFVGCFVASIFHIFLIIVYFKDWTKDESLIQNKIL